MNDSINGLARKGSVTWTLEGAAGNENFESIGLWPLRTIEKSGALPPYGPYDGAFKSRFAFVDEVAETPAVMMGLQRSDGKYIYYRSEGILIRESIQLSHGSEQHPQGVLTVDGQYTSTAELSVNCVENKEVVGYVRLLEKFLPSQNGPVAEIRVRFFDDTTSKLLAADKVSPSRPLFNLILTQLPKHGDVSVGHSIRMSVLTSLKYSTGVRGTWDIAGQGIELSLTVSE
ncbi:MAG: hypothetical protein JSS56_16780 [Proteobacteria bacterium]|nr:hypothetical protein [Pseudomonadota bacterium]